MDVYGPAASGRNAGRTLLLRVADHPRVEAEIEALNETTARLDADAATREQVGQPSAISRSFWTLGHPLSKATLTACDLT